MRSAWIIQVSPKLNVKFLFETHGEENTEKVI